ncbi:MAG: sulfatase [Eubacteriales bacterium]
MKKPNLILVYPDEMRYDTMSYTGNTVSKTPAIDALAKEGVSFDNAHTSFPLCCPFRASLMTGKYAHEHGILCNHYKIPLEQEFLPNMMKEHGYRTGWVGKWHLNGGNKFQPVEKEYRLGFDEFIGYSRGHQYLEGLFYKDDDETPYRSHKYEPEYQTDQLIDFANRAVDEEVPFMGMICYGLPHHPVELAPDHYKYKYKPEDMKLTPIVPTWCEEAARKYMAMYYGLVSCVDDQIARITAFLKEKGIEDNTILIFVSDHGDMCYENGYTDKYIAHNGSTHVPFIIKYPDLVKEQVKVSQVIDPTIGLTPTILDLCGIPVPTFMQGKSLKDAMLNGRDDSLNDYSYYQLPKISESLCDQFDYIAEKKNFPERGLRTDRFLYVEKCGVPYEMYDLTKDTYEQFNCVENYNYLYEMLELRKKLREVMEEVGDDWEVELKEFPEHYYKHCEGDTLHDDIYKIAVYID